MLLSPFRRDEVQGVALLTCLGESKIEAEWKVEINCGLPYPEGKCQ